VARSSAVSLEYAVLKADLSWMPYSCAVCSILRRIDGPSAIARLQEFGQGFEILKGEHVESNEYPDNGTSRCRQLPAFEDGEAFVRAMLLHQVMSRTDAGQARIMINTSKCSAWALQRLVL
jgi:hypothetical protein